MDIAVVYGMVLRELVGEWVQGIIELVVTWWIAWSVDVGMLSER